jgi:ribose transport system ATP-binding protein
VLARDARAGGIRDFPVANRRAAKALAELAIRTPSAQINAGSLSGGNQQKVLLARLLETEPRVIILDEPTRGVDVGAKSEIYRLIDSLAKKGMAILMISSELPEVVGIADRVLVMREGAIAGEVMATEGKPLSQEAIIELATGADQR